MLMDQKQLCDCMIDDKNKLINDFNQVRFRHALDFYRCIFWIELVELFLQKFKLKCLINNLIS